MGEFGDNLGSEVSSTDVPEISDFSALDDQANFSKELAQLLNKIAREASTDHPDSDFGVSVDGAVQQISDISSPQPRERYYVDELKSTVVYVASSGKYRIEGAATVPTDSDRPNSDNFTAGSKIIVDSTGKEYEVQE